MDTHKEGQRMEEEIQREKHKRGLRITKGHVVTYRVYTIELEELQQEELSLLIDKIEENVDLDGFVSCEIDFFGTTLTLKVEAYSTETEFGSDYYDYSDLNRRVPIWLEEVRKEMIHRGDNFGSEYYDYAELNKKIPKWAEEIQKECT